MAVWVDSTWYGAHVADLGPYIGPLPSAAPIPANVPVDASMIYYFIGEKDTGADLTVDSGFIGDVSLAVGRGWNSTPGDTSDMFTDHFDAGIDPTAALTILVAYYEGTAPPAMAPESLVPPQFASGATGSPVMDPTTGAWSGPLTVSLTTTGSVTGDAAQLLIGGADGIDSDPAVSEQQWIDNLAASTTGSSSAGTAPALFGLDTTRASVSSWRTTDMTLSLGAFGGVGTSRAQQLAQFTAAPTVAGSHDFATLLTQLGAPYDTWIEGLDYWAIPASDYVFFQYDGTDAAAFTEWGGPLDLVIQRSGENHNPGHQAYDSIGFSIRVIPGAMPTVPVTDGDGSLAGSVTVTDDVSQTDASASIPLGTDRVVTVALKPDLGSLGPPFATFSPSSTQIGWGAEMIATATPGATYLGAVFRVWIPGAGGPKWHTVGGHWATVGGATLQILTPLPGGSVWVDVVDGPA